MSKFLSDDGITFVHELLEKGFDLEQIAVAVANEVFKYISNLEEPNPEARCE